MNYLYINVFLVVVILLLISMKYLIGKKCEAFSVSAQRRELAETMNYPATSPNNEDIQENSEYVKNSDSMTDMLKALENLEQLCWDMEQRQDIKDKDKLIRLQNSKMSDLEEQDRQIAELKNLFTFLKAEKMKKQNVLNRCRSKKQNKINKDYNLAQKLAKENLLKDESVKLDLNLSKVLGNMQTKSNNNTQTKCKSMNTNRFIHADKLKGKCVNCSSDSLKKNSEFLNRDF